VANRVTLMGRLGKDPELTFIQSGTACCKFSMATSESYFDKATNQKVEKVEWHNVVAWGKQGETLRQYVKKGQQLYLEGKIHYNKWQDKEGNNKISTEIICDRFEFVGSKSNGDETSKASKPASQPKGVLQDDDIPF
jgi:single-strand DNA-binding protein